MCPQLVLEAQTEYSQHSSFDDLLSANSSTFVHRSGLRETLSLGKPVTPLLFQIQLPVEPIRWHFENGL